MTIAVLTALHGPSETAVARELAAAARTEVTRRCADLAELLAAAAAGLGDVAVVAVDTPGMEREVVRHLHGSGVWVVVVADGRSGGVDPAALGADLLVAAGGHGVADLLVATVDEAERTGRRPGVRADGDLDPVPLRPAPVPDTVRRLGPLPAGPTADPGGGDGLHAGPGRLVAVWGPAGAPGRSTVAINLAAELARRPDAVPGDVLLVDADTYGGTVAQRLGLLDEAPGLAAAARTGATGRLDPRVLAAHCPAIDGGPRVLTGISRADRWTELPPAHLEPVWEGCRDLAAWTVVDTGFCLEVDEALSYDTRAPRRNGATLSALAEADLVVVVGAGDPVGLQRLVRGLGDLAEVGVAPEQRVVAVTRVRSSVTGPRPAHAIREALHRYAGVDEVHVVPEDAAACDGALLAGRTLAEHAPASPARRALVDLAGALLARHGAMAAH